MLHQRPKYVECNGHHLSSSTCPRRRWVRAPTFWVIAWHSNSKPGARYGRLLMETMRCLWVMPAWWTVSVWVAGSHVAAAVVAGGRVIPQDTTMRRSFWSTMHTTTLYSNQTVCPLSELHYNITQQSDSVSTIWSTLWHHTSFTVMNVLFYCILNNIFIYNMFITHASHLKGTRFKSCHRKIMKQYEILRFQNSAGSCYSPPICYAMQFGRELWKFQWWLRFLDAVALLITATDRICTDFGTTE
jgi:hypothetical protein